MDSKKYIEILKNCKFDINNLHLNDILLLWDNDSKHKSEMCLDYYIENKIQLLEWPAYSSDLNLIEGVWVNIKYKLGGSVYKKIQSLKSDIKEDRISCAANLSSIVGGSMRKRIYAWILNKEKE